MIIRSIACVFVCSIVAAQPVESNQPLCRAAQTGDIVAVRSLLAAGTNPDVLDNQGLTPLMCLASLAARAVTRDIPKPAQHDHLGVARLLLDRGAAVNARDPHGRTPLLLSIDGSASEYRVLGSDQNLARLLIDRGASVNAHDDQGWTPLLKAIGLWAEQPAFIDFLISKNAGVNAQLNDGRTALMLAAHLGKDDRLPVLVAHGARVNKQDNSGTTVLMIAAESQWDEQAAAMMKFLTSNGADLNLQDKQGRTPADRAAAAGYIDRARFLIDRGTKVASLDAFLATARNQALLRAIEQGNSDTARDLLDHGADPDFRAPDGRTLLMIAATAESAAKAKLLIDHGAHANLSSPAKESALMFAADEYRAEVVRLLLDHDADPNAVDRDGNTALLRAAASKRNWQEDRQPVIASLLSKGADPRPRNSHGVTALMLMAGEGNPAFPLVLERAAADTDARDDQGNTALLYAARYFVRGEQRRAGWALLQKGADVNASNNLGETALILAATQYEPDAARLLLAKNANVNARTKRGRTALMQAIDGPKDFDNEHHIVYSPAIARLLIESGADVNARDLDGNSPLKLARQRGYEDIAADLIKAGAKD